MKTLKEKQGYAVFEVIIIILVLVVVGLAGALIYKDNNKSKISSLTLKVASSNNTKTTESSETISNIPLSINPINPAAIPIGDHKVSTTPENGYVDSCITSFPSTGGAQSDGPWINQAAGTWDSLTKIAVQGSVSWPNAYYTNTISGNSRMITTNDLPINHPTGTFPISRTDPAYSYDQNPNSIKAQPASWMLPANPVAADKPSCTGGGAIGILTDGVFLFNALDGEGRDAGAHEVLDSYQGHPDMSDTYHHHVVPTFMLGTAANKSSSILIGYAIDGYGIYVERDADGNLLTDANLDACHGRTSDVMWNGKMNDIYHYDATLEYPYTVGCFHGTPIQTSVTMNMN